MPVVVPENTSNGHALHVHQDAAMCVPSLAKKSRVEHRLAPERKAYLFTIEGKVQLNNNSMQTRNAAKIEKESKLSIQAGGSAELILLELLEKYAINNQIQCTDSSPAP